MKSGCARETEREREGHMFYARCGQSKTNEAKTKKNAKPAERYKSPQRINKNKSLPELMADGVGCCEWAKRETEKSKIV